jgi:hypothetical protein
VINALASAKIGLVEADSTVPSVGELVSMHFALISVLFPKASKQAGSDPPRVVATDIRVESQADVGTERSSGSPLQSAAVPLGVARVEAGTLRR